MRPDETLVAGDLKIRRHQLSDAPHVHAAILESTEHLRPWMPFIAAEPLTVADRERLISEVFANGWEEETDFAYGLFIDGEVVGGCGLHRRGGPDVLEVGYWIRAGYTGRGLATAAVRALCDAAFRLEDVDHVEIHHDKANTVSGRIPARLGFVLVRETDDVIAAPGEIGIDCEWRLDRPSSET